HFMEEAEYCDRIQVIYRAAPIALGTPDSLKSDAASRTGDPDPTLQDAFISLIEDHDARRARTGDAA
ncbi:MAG: hypothetical protein KC417_10210, partial [Myxococcales bacterium]|nr:hypothetical protein [Myxococcales bacterium]